MASSLSKLSERAIARCRSWLAPGSTARWRRQTVHFPRPRWINRLAAAISACDESTLLLIACSVFAVWLTILGSYTAWVLGFQPIPLAQAWCAIAAVMLIPRLPMTGALILIVLEMSGTWLPFAPLLQLLDFAAMAALVVLGYRQVSVGVLAVLAMAVNRPVYGWLMLGVPPFSTGGMMSTVMVGVMDIGYKLAFVLLGFTLARMMASRQIREQLRRAQQREAIANRLHDRTCNELSLVVMHLDGLLASGADAEELSQIRDDVANTLSHTRAIAAELRHDDGDLLPISHSDHTSQDEHLRQLVDEWRARLSAHGLAGQVMMPGTLLPPVGTERFVLLTGLVEELFGNIGKYANPSNGYMVAIGWDGQIITISAADTPSPSRTGAPADSPTPTSGGEGLSRYAAALEAVGGSCQVGQSADEWSSYCEIPCAANRSQ